MSVYERILQGVSMDTRLDAASSDTAVAPRQLLPLEAYTGAEWFRREQETLFAHSWVFAGMTEDLKDPGDYLAVEAGTIPLFLLRGHDGELRAFHNVCRHRGVRLLEGRGNVGRRVVCFYHSWSYELTGELASVTLERDQFPAIDKSCLGLQPAKVGIWQNLVFVNADPAAEDLSDWLGDLPAKTGPHVPDQRGPFAPEALVEVASVVYRVRANWKVVVENFIDGYHLPLLHRVSLADGDFMKQRWEPVGRHISFYRPLKPGIAHDNLALPVIDGVPATFGLAYYWLFPNVGISETATRWSTFHVIPLARPTSRSCTAGPGPCRRRWSGSPPRSLRRACRRT